MAQRRFHYEQAFEHYLRANRVPYVAVDEAKKALLPATAKKKAAQSVDAVAALKSFDFVVYAPHGNLLVDVKGRMFGSAKTDNPMSNRRYESWVTRDDVDSLTAGRNFSAGTSRPSSSSRTACGSSRPMRCSMNSSPSASAGMPCARRPLPTMFAKCASARASGRRYMCPVRRFPDLAAVSRPRDPPAPQKQRQGALFEAPDAVRAFP